MRVRLGSCMSTAMPPVGKTGAWASIKFVRDKHERMRTSLLSVRTKPLTSGGHFCVVLALRKWSSSMALGGRGLHGAPLHVLGADPWLCAHRDEDQLALFMELLGRMPRRQAAAGKCVSLACFF